ncbi:MAG: family 43 glycosylhydrolase [Mucilaginibacter polytrichastri]|nr:family 43 glycosylhydrolase [Mucilaginibacter polytrichastri]
MKTIITALITCFFLSKDARAQLSVKYNANEQSTQNLQYFRPKGNLFVGDCMPFYRNGTYSLYWLLDSAHHAALGGLGGHQWALSRTQDLKHWQQFPVVLGIDEDWEKSICTGSVVFHKGKYYAFYATRLVDKEGKTNEQLSYAVSSDGVHFRKQKPNPFYTSAPGYSKRDFRDPKVFVDPKTGEFHLFVSSWQENGTMHRTGGALVHLSSKELKNWSVLDPVLTGQPSVPECPDYFFWKGWYYIIYGDSGDTYYLKSRSPYGPWEEPRYQALREAWVNVAKTAEFTGGRRISAGWIPGRRDNKDHEGEVFGGNMVFREVIQESDGTLSTRFPEEMIPAAGTEIRADWKAERNAQLRGDGSLALDGGTGYAAASLQDVPGRCRITLQLEPGENIGDYGLMLRSDEHAENGYDLRFSPREATVQLADDRIYAVDEIRGPTRVDIILNDDIIDVSINNRRCIVNRLPEQKGTKLWLYAKHGRLKAKMVGMNGLK